MKRSVLVISPSGNLYGSEQVLCDYLKLTKGDFEVAVPARSKLEKHLQGSRHEVVPFSSVKGLYFTLLLRLLRGEFRCVYVNEAGHSRYIQLLSALFKKVRFVVHVRILEDTSPDRWRSLRPSNTILISISDFLKRQLSMDSVLIYDLYRFPVNQTVRSDHRSDRIQLAVIGRLTYTKGYRELVSFVRELEFQGKVGEFVINVYGDVMSDVLQDLDFGYLNSRAFVNFHGFVPNERIYEENDLVLHLSKVEPLGRIFFEAVSAGLPLVGFNSGGIGEIAANVGMVENLVEPGPAEATALVSKLEEVIANTKEQEFRLANAFERMKNLYNEQVYTDSVDHILLEDI